jgi:amino acid transporter
VSEFITAYINLPIFVVTFVGWKIYKKTKVWDPLERDFVTGIPTIEETEVPEVPPRNIAEKIAAVLF